MISFFMFIIMFYSMVASCQYAQEVVRTFIKERELSGKLLLLFYSYTLVWCLIMVLYFEVEWV